ncbi:MAG: peptidoglycan-binding protein [Sphingomonadaceae bacterium]|nr:peptidoglycan-binding protein [Sphingomonadaceae bacterium]
MKENFKAALDFVMAHECVFATGHEGDFSRVMTEDVSGDHGGLTKFGIDQRSHPDINIRALDYLGAARIYRDGEWTKCRCDELPEGFDVAVFDTAVNCGVGTAALMLQRALNDEGAEPPLQEDGFIGPKTIAAAARNRGALMHYLALRDSHYGDLVAENIDLRKFMRGWLNRLGDLTAALTTNGDMEAIV